MPLWLENYFELKACEFLKPLLCPKAEPPLRDSTVTSSPWEQLSSLLTGLLISTTPRQALHRPIQSPIYSPSPLSSPRKTVYKPQILTFFLESWYVCALKSVFSLADLSFVNLQAPGYRTLRVEKRLLFPSLKVVLCVCVCVCVCV